VVRTLRKTLALSLTVLGMTSTLALAQPGNTNANVDTRASTAMASSAGTSATSANAGTSATNAAGSEDPYWNQSWNYVGSGGSNLGLRNGMNPYAAPLEPHGFNSPGADYSGYAVPPRS
jgi:hypothetical protein